MDATEIQPCPLVCLNTEPLLLCRRLDEIDVAQDVGSSTVVFGWGSACGDESLLCGMTVFVRV